MPAKWIGAASCFRYMVCSSNELRAVLEACFSRRKPSRGEGTPSDTDSFNSLQFEIGENPDGECDSPIERVVRPGKRGHPDPFPPPSIAFRRHLGKLFHVAIERYAVEWNNDNFAAMNVVSQFLRFGHIQDREGKD